ncbi:hypothetical protein [Mycolicibacterium sphagni]|uniref:Keratin associated protein n=1 Tax=Mycolicibacterium sphagni TaxID=1786 RepID=A0A255DGG6_9MYCO|nr:hypothetical protein [Mycolicibacterium sphagni]MCV7175889.1 hypothetical protein [Mycolicibacterium sphagni]OYN78190.1 hypothetical protein CG716_16370 [Mycolicibacterium sphagni]
MMITLRHLAPVVAAGAAALALGLAPSAAAAPNPIDCQDRGGATMCQKQGHARIHTAPPVTSPQQAFGFNGIPMWVLG